MFPPGIQTDHSKIKPSFPLTGYFNGDAGEEEGREGLGAPCERRLQGRVWEGPGDTGTPTRVRLGDGGRARGGRAAEERRRIKAHLPSPVKRKRKWVFILWISLAPGRGAEEASQCARSEPPRPLPDPSRRRCRRRGSERGRHVLFELQ